MTWQLYMFLCSILVFLLLLVATCIPYTCMRTCCASARPIVISLLGCASCGVFIATCFLGLVPHVRHQEMNLRSQNTTSSAEGGSTYLPSTDELVVIGFLMILISEQIIHGIGHSMGSKPTPSSPQHNIKLRKFLHEDGDDVEPLVEVEATNIDDDNDEIIFRQASTSPRHCDSSSMASSVVGTPNVRVWFLLLGMSVHSFFEGVALGVQNESDAFYQILFAILFHEVLCCVSYGVQLAKHNASKTYAYTSIIFLSATIPIGMLLALMIDGIEGERWQKVGRYWLEGLAAGTFVHVALVELLPMELHSEGGHGHSHSVVGDETGNNNQHHGHSHSKDVPSHWTPLLKTLFVAGGIGIFVVAKSLIGKG